LRSALIVAQDLLREAASRRWFLALGVGITLVLALMAAALKMEVVDGALAATSIFGRLVDRDIQAADVALRPIFGAAAYVIFYAGLVFGVLACADFGPSLLSPGRIEYLLSLPVSRAELLFGTFLGVLAIAFLAALYGASGFVVILGVKTGVWNPRLIAAALLASTSFAALYGAMLTGALVVRSSALSAVIGLGLFALGIVAGHRGDMAPVFEEGFARKAFEALTLFLPPISKLAEYASRFASQANAPLGEVAGRLLGLLVFGVASLLVGVWRFEEADF
jgi:Cu-processing system permease protein